MGGFDPAKYGAVPVDTSGEFDPTKYGAVPVAAQRPGKLRPRGPLQPAVPTAQQAYQQGLQSASQQGALGKAAAAAGSQIIPAYHAAVQSTFGTPTLSQVPGRIAQGLSYEVQHPIDAASLVLKGLGASIAGPIYSAIYNKNASASERLSQAAEGVANAAGMGSSIAQASRQAGAGQYGAAAGTMVPAIAQFALAAKVPGDVKEGLQGVASPVTKEMAGGLKTEAGDVITPTLGTVAASGGAPAFQRVVSQIPGGQTLRTAGQTAIGDAAAAYTRAMVRTAEQAGAPLLDSQLAKYPVRDIGMRTQVVADAIKQHASSLYDQLSEAYSTNPKVFQPVAGELSSWAENTLKKSDIDRIMSASPEFGGALKKSLAELQKAEYLRSGAQVSGEPIDLMANYQNARSDLKSIQMGAKSARDRMVAGQAVDALDKAITEGFSKTGNSALNELYQQANAKYRQASALKDLGEALEPAYKNIEPQNQIGSQARPTFLSATKVADALTELSKVPVRSEKSRLMEAVPNPVDQKTIQQIASFLVKNEAAGGHSIAGQFGVLRGVEAPSDIITNPTRPLAVAAYALRLPGTAKVLAWAMTNRAFASSLLELSRAAPGTAHAAALAARINASVAQWESQNAR